MNAHDFHGYTVVLMWSADAGVGYPADCVAGLMKHPYLDVNRQDFVGYSALTWACDRGRTEIVKILLGDESLRIRHSILVG